MELFEEPAERPRQRFFLWAREQETSALALPATGEATLTFVPSAGGEATLSIARPEDDADLAAFCAAFLQELSRLGYLPAPTETLTKELVPPLGPETPRKPGESDGAADRAAGRAAASGGHDEPWRVIKGKQEREMVRLWWQGYTKPEIAKQFGIAKVKTLENLFSTMRGTYGRKVVPTLDDLRRRKIR